MRSDSSAVDAFSDSLAYALNAGDYDKSYSYVLLLSQRDTLSSDALYDCAYCMMSKGKYEECLAFCDKWQNKIPDNNYEELFLPLRGECCYNLKDYDQALQYIIRYDQLLADMGERPSFVIWACMPKHCINSICMRKQMKFIRDASVRH